MEPAPDTVLPPAPEGPGTLAALRPPAFNVLLFLLTFASAFVAGAVLTDTQLPEPTQAEALRHGVGFAAALLFILLAHEMGHFVLARRHRVDATWPFFIPAPLFSMIGTLGAVIRLRSLPRTRRALIDIGAAGPIAGFLATLPVLYIGLRLSTVVNAEPAHARWSLFEAIYSYVTQGVWPHMGDAIELGEPLCMQLFERLVWGTLPAGKTLALHPVAVAGWFGFFLTALNLLPLGQLDGGHVLQACSPALHRLLGPPLAALLVALGVFTAFPGWTFWGLLMGMGLGFHPPVSEPEETLPLAQKLIAAVSLALFVGSFSPVPLAMLAG